MCADSCYLSFVLPVASSPLHHADIAHVHHHVGNTAQLACPTGGSGSSVRWRREGGLLPEGAWSDKVGTLHLPGQVENSGVYECFTCSRNESVPARMEITFFRKRNSDAATITRVHFDASAVIAVFLLVHGSIRCSITETHSHLCWEWEQCDTELLAGGIPSLALQGVLVQG